MGWSAICHKADSLAAPHLVFSMFVHVHTFGPMMRELANARELDRIARVIREHGPRLIGAEGVTVLLRKGEGCDGTEKERLGKRVTILPVGCEDLVASIAVCWPSAHVATPDELSVLQTIADATGLAIDNVHLSAAARAASARAEQSARDSETLL